MLKLWSEISPSTGFFELRLTTTFSLIARVYSVFAFHSNYLKYDRRHIFRGGGKVSLVTF